MQMLQETAPVPWITSTRLQSVDRIAYNPTETNLVSLKVLYITNNGLMFNH